MADKLFFALLFLTTLSFVFTVYNTNIKINDDLNSYLDSHNYDEDFVVLDSRDYDEALGKFGLSTIKDVSTSALAYSRLRTRRSTSPLLNSSAIAKTTAALHDSHNQLLVHWAGKGSDIIIALAKEGRETNTSVLFVSTDYGKTWPIKNLTYFVNGYERQAVIRQFYKNPNIRGYYVFVDILHHFIYHSRDYCRTIHKHSLVFRPDRIYFHPTNYNCLLALDETTHWIYQSKNFGTSWRRIRSGVKAVHLGVANMDPNSVYIETMSYNLNTLVNMTVLPWISERSLMTGISQSSVSGRYIFVVKPASTSRSFSELWVSKDRGSFNRAQFPGFTQAKDFHIADASEDQVFVCVITNTTVSDLYISDRSGLHYALSLTNVVYYNPKIHTTSLLKRQNIKKPFADITKVNGLQGVYIASQFPSVKHRSLTMQTTVITFNKGGYWRQITAPTKYYGIHTNCDMHKRCSLHLSQMYNYLYPFRRTTPVLSSKNAPGLIVATGSTGTSLKGHLGMYISSDGGVKWRTFNGGNYFYAMADHGGLIVAVARFMAIKHFSYSWDEGRTWKTDQFTEQRMKVYGLLTEPGETTTVFSIFGSFSSKHSWRIIQLNLTGIFPRVCQRQDYMHWSLYVNRQSCDLGKKVVYDRRIPNVACLNGREFERGVVEKNCSCTRQDYECDVGYYTDKKSQNCYPSYNITFEPPSVCPVGMTYPKTIGYRRVSDDQCVGGASSLYEPHTLFCPSPEQREFMLYVRSQTLIQRDLATRTETHVKQRFQGTNAAFDYAENCVYWSKYPRSIKKLCLNGTSSISTFLTTKSTVLTMNYDWTGQNLYWAEKTGIYVASTDGRFRKMIVADRSNIFCCLNLDPVRGYMFWVERFGSRMVIKRASMDGDVHSIETLMDNRYVNSLVDLTIDLTTDSLYWTNGANLMRSNLDGSGTKNISVISHRYAQFIAVFKRRVYWYDSRNHVIASADKFNGYDVKLERRNTRVNSFMKIYHRASQHTTNQCHDTQLCPQLCLARHGEGPLQSVHGVSYTCMCGDNYARNGTGAMCQCEHNETLVRGMCLPHNGSPCGSDQFECTNKTCIMKYKQCDGKIDCSDRSDETDCVGEERCPSSQFRCESGGCISIDYVCDHDKDCSDGSDEKSCNFTCGINTMLCLDGRCIPSSWRCDMDDDCEDMSDEKSCTHNATACLGSQFSCANSSHCIPQTWVCDGTPDCSDASDENATHCTTVTCGPDKFSCGDGMCISRSWVCDREADCADKRDEQHCTYTTTVGYTTASPCSSHGAFLCYNGHCVTYSDRCNNVDDCGDMSDEYGCSTPGTRFTQVPTTAKPIPCNTVSMFECLPGSRTRCVPISWVCDGMADCDQGEDEARCPNGTVCTVSQFRCDSIARCINMKLVCDGISHCPDNSDESSCSTPHYTTASRAPTKSCASKSLFRCGTGACVTPDLVCNHRRDCSDGSDEGNRDCGQRVKFLWRMIRRTSVQLKWRLDTKLLGVEDVRYLPAYSLGTSFHNLSTTRYPEFNFTNLMPHSRYAFYVYVSRGGVIHYPSKITESTLGTYVPQTPVNITATLLQDSESQLSVSVTWSSVGPVANFIVYLTHDSEHWTDTVSGIPGHVGQYSHTFKGIPDDHNKDLYVVQISAVNLEGLQSKKSTTVRVKWHGLPSPGYPYMITQTGGSLDLVWTGVKGAVGYNISYRDGWNVPRSFIADKSPRKKVFYSSCDQLSSYTIHAYNKQTTSLEVQFMTPDVHCSSTVPPPTEFTVTSKSKTTVIAQWKYSQKVAKGSKFVVFYTPEVDVNGLPDIPLKCAKVFSDKKMVVIPGLQACAQYRFWVAVNGTWLSGMSTRQFLETDADRQAQPKHLKARETTKLTKICALVTWDTFCNTDVISVEYILNVREIHPTPSRFVGQWSSAPRMIVATHGAMPNFRFTLCGLRRGATYEVKVKTSVPGARWSAAVNVTITPIEAPVSVEPISNATHFFMNWERPSSMTSDTKYYIFYQKRCVVTTCDASIRLFNSTTVTSFVVPKWRLDINQTYEFFLATGPVGGGYMSSLSHPGVLVEGPHYKLAAPAPHSAATTTSSVNLVAIMVPVAVVIAVLIAIIVVIAIRHQRIQRSFLSFASSHYNTETGTTTFSADGLNSEDTALDASSESDLQMMLDKLNDVVEQYDDDEYSPMITGFSDDVPMLTA